MIDWKKLLNSERRKPTNSKDPRRTELERDYDRILFSTPVRRLADKTQVFPLEKNDSVRTRLTHSHEVSNLARGIGIDLAYNYKKKLKAERVQNFNRDLPSLLATIGLAHDLGNPPFGHQGEAAIQSWFKSNPEVLKGLPGVLKTDFTKFEGNAQTFRLLTKLQLLNDNYGLNLTYASLSAIIKYPIDSYRARQGGKKKIHSKHGYFNSESKIIDEIWQETRLKKNVRHPLTYIMEACDDIAYSILDSEDAVKKGLVSFNDLMDFLDSDSKDAGVNSVLKKAKTDNVSYKKLNLSSSELNDLSMQKFRVYAIHRMISDITIAYVDNFDKIIDNKVNSDLMEISDSKTLCTRIKAFDKKHAYKHKSVLEIELVGYNTIRGLMDILWKAIVDRKDKNKLDSARNTPYTAYAYGRISENYRRIFLSDGDKLSIRYKELQLLTDMISGMTDSFAISLFKELKTFNET